MPNIVLEVTNAVVEPRIVPEQKDGSFFLLRFDQVAPRQAGRQPSGLYVTLTMAKVDAERLLQQLVDALDPPELPPNLN